MADQLYSLAELAQAIDAQIQGDPDFRVSAIGTLQSAGANEISFIANAKYRKYLQGTCAGAVILSESDLPLYSGNALIVANPYLAYAQLSHKFALQPNMQQGISASAQIDPSAHVSPSAMLGPGVVVAAHCQIENGVVIGANTVIGESCVIGANTRIHANVSLYSDVHIGADCLIHSGAVIGADGFGFANDKGRWLKIAQLGGVRIGNRVEVGAGTTIDRGAIEPTQIADGVILDNQIQIAHNVQIGKNTAIAACTAIAGSAKIGADCTISGACGIVGHINITPGTHINAMTMVTKSIDKPGAYSSGTGMLEHRQWKTSVIRFRQLDEISKRLKNLEDRVTENKDS